jgi:hypothetical protein
VFRWNLYEFALTQIGPGAEGRTRYTFTSQLPPNNAVSIERDPNVSFPTDTSRNLATDKKFEITVSTLHRVWTAREGEDSARDGLRFLGARTGAARS